jgi:hypothetical protein
MTARTNVSRLSDLLFTGPVTASDFNVVEGTSTDVSTERLALSLTESLSRVGLVRDGVLLDVNRA